MYTFETKIGYSKTGCDLEMTIPAILESFQDAATFESQEGKITMEYLQERNLVWFLSAWQIVINRKPKMNETVKVTTYPYEFKGFLGYRNFVITTIHDEILIKGNSVCTLINTRNMHPQKVNAEIMEGYELEDRLDMDYAPRKIELTSEGVEKQKFKVYSYQIDSNCHMNNVEYVKLAMELIPGDKLIKQVRVEYKNPAYCGDIITSILYLEDKIIKVKLQGDDGRIFAIVEFE